jgi:hypothetical protein
MADYYVYAYIDPRNNEPFYIGAGHGGRAWIHLSLCKQGGTHFYNKLRKLLDTRIESIVHLIVENVTKKQAFQIWEPFFIKAIGRQDLRTGPLCNHTDGVAGSSNLSPEARARRSAASKKQWADPEYRARKSAASKKQWADPEYRAHTSAAQKKGWTPEARARKSASERNRPPRKGKKFKGISRKGDKYVSSIHENGKEKHLGTCDTAEEAAKLYNDAVDLYWGGDGWKNPV